jgi:hypothetical protein
VSVCSHLVWAEMQTVRSSLTEGYEGMSKIIHVC